MITTALSSSSASDSTLVRQANQGCSESYDTLVRRYYERVLRFCARRVSDPLIAEDLTQEVFTTAYINLTKLRKPDEFHSWLLGIAFNVIKRFFTDSQQALIEIPYETLVDAMDQNRLLIAQQSTPEDVVLSLPDFSPYLELVDTLPHKSRESLRLYCVNDMSYEEMAKVLGVSVNTVHQRVHYGKTQLKNKLMSPSVPKEIREQAARMATSYLSDHAKLRGILACDELTNHTVLALLNSAKTWSVSVTVYAYDTNPAENLIVLSQRKSGRTVAVIKSANRDAVQVLVHLLPSNQLVRLYLTAPQMCDVIQQYCRVFSKRQYRTYGLLPDWLNTDLILGRVVRLDLPESFNDWCLLRRDRRLAAVLSANQDSGFRSSYQFYASPDSSLENPHIYALFARSGSGNLYELVHHSPFDRSSRALLCECISSACQDLLDQGFCVAYNVIDQGDTDHLDLLQQVGFRLITTGVAATVRRL